MHKCADAPSRLGTLSRQRTTERGRDLADQLGSGGVAVGGFLEEEEGGQGFAGDFQSMEDGDHLVGEPADFGGLSFLQMGDRQVEGGQRGVEGVALVEKPLADLSEAGGLRSPGRPRCPGSPPPTRNRPY